MNKLNLKNINLNSPYMVYEREDKQLQLFATATLKSDKHHFSLKNLSRSAWITHIFCLNLADFADIVYICTQKNNVTSS